MHAEVWLSEQDTGGDDACQEGEDDGRVGTRRGAHLCGQGSERKDGESQYKYEFWEFLGISMRITGAWEVFRAIGMMMRTLTRPG